MQVLNAEWQTITQHYFLRRTRIKLHPSAKNGSRSFLPDRDLARRIMRFRLDQLNVRVWDIIVIRFFEETCIRRIKSRRLDERTPLWHIGAEIRNVPDA